MSEPLSFAEANSFQKAMRRFASSGLGSWIFAHTAHHIDKPVYRWTKGRHTFGSMITGLPVVMLTTTGAKSGKQRTVPVLGLPIDGKLAVIASNFGQHNTPGWGYNLKANPDGELAVSGQRRSFRAVAVEGELRQRVWDTGLRIYPGFDQYAARAAHRHINVFVLEPTS
jgi:deazaflavin-dependent oxidoreductase (nitroreductase family)